jgi:hypothetical protein
LKYRWTTLAANLLPAEDKNRATSLKYNNITADTATSVTLPTKTSGTGQAAFTITSMDFRIAPGQGGGGGCGKRSGTPSSYGDGASAHFVIVTFFNIPYVSSATTASIQVGAGGTAGTSPGGTQYAASTDGTQGTASYITYNNITYKVNPFDAAIERAVLVQIVSPILSGS